jgi:CHAD domain-containing protein
VLRAAGRSRDRGVRGIPLNAMADAGDGLRHALRPLVDAMADELELCAGPTPDPEHLHQARVALRAVRALLGLLGGTLNLPAGRLRRLRRRLQRLQADTGRPRDLDVQRDAWASDPDAPAVLLRWVHDAREAAAAELESFLASGDAARALRRLRHAIRARDDRRPVGAPVALVVRTAVYQAWTAVLEEGRAITPSSPADDLHDLRKSCKKLRYLLETFQRILPEGDGQAAVRDLKGLQTLLGEFQDLHVALDLVAEARAALEVSDADLAALDGYVAALDGRIAAVRERFHEAFARFDTPVGARRLREVVGTAARAP